MKMGRKGIALISVLMLVVVLLIMVLALMRLLQHQVFETRVQLDRLAATYVAEAGVAHALLALNSDYAWTDGFEEQPTLGARGTFTIRFNTTGEPFASGESVNNLGGDAAADGPRGEGSVPARSALLVCEGRVGTAVRVLEVLVQRRGLVAIRSPILASGPVHLNGPTEVSGLTSLDGEAVDVVVHSNFPGSGSDPTITWEPTSPGDRAVVDGRVTTSDPRPPAQSIDFGADPAAYSITEMASGESPLPFPAINVGATVRAHAADPAPVLGSGLTVIPAGNHYLSSGLDVSGDLLLEPGAKLFVEGDALVNGSIRGEGSVYVNGEIHFYGDTQIASGNRMAVLSSGDIHLEGFDGTAYLRGIPGAAPIMDDISLITDRMLYYLDNPTAPPPPPFVGIFGNMQVLDALNHQLGAEPTSGATFFPGIGLNRLGDLKALVEAQPATSSRDFLVQKLTDLRTFTHWQSPSTLTAPEVRDLFLANPGFTIDRAADTTIDTLDQLPPAEFDRGVALLRNMFASFSYDRLGSSYFQGLLYSNGNVRATHQVTVLGSVVADGPAGEGSISLEGGSSVTLMEEFFRDGDGAIDLESGLGMSTWAGR